MLPIAVNESYDFEDAGHTDRHTSSHQPPGAAGMHGTLTLADNSDHVASVLRETQSSLTPRDKINSRTRELSHPLILVARENSGKTTNFSRA